MKISPARKSAFEILKRIDNEKSYSAILLPRFEENLDPKDSSLCHELTLGVLRKKLYLDYTIQQFTKKKLDKFDIEVLIALRIGLYQLFFLDKIPDYSAINESVNLVKAAKKRSASGLVNAVLRRASKEKPENGVEGAIERLSIETSHPEWLLRKWETELGFEKTQALSNANNLIPALAFRVTKKFNESPEKFKDDFFEYIHSKESGVSEFENVRNCFVAKRITEKLRQFSNLSLIYFQDPASQMVADIVSPKRGERFLDLCASPGSKTSRIAATNCEQDTRMISGDLYDGRIRNLRSNLSDQRIDNVKVVQYNAEAKLPFAERSFDVVLVDAPCSGTGTIRHNPEIRYSLKDSDFEALSRKQLSLLKNASKVVKIGGRIIYSTCSIERDENENVIAEFLRENGDFGIKADEKLNPDFVTPDGFCRTFPQRDNMDGFFVAILSRKA